MAQWHLREMVSQQRTTRIVGFVEPSPRSRTNTMALFDDAGLACPPFYDDLKSLVKTQGSAHTALIVSPHKFHFEHARDCLNLGMDVLIEKPMVLNASEARRLITVRDRTKRLLVIAFPGSLSPAVHKAKELIRKRTLGRVIAVTAHVHQNWKKASRGTWRQVPEISGGGFLFDTGSHMVNTVVDLVGTDVEEVTAVFDNAGAPVEILSSVSGRFANGTLFSLTGAGDSISCESVITVMGTKGVMQTGIWGERLGLKTQGGEFRPVPYGRPQGVWTQFLKVRAGKLPNPCPPEVGLRFATLMDMMRKSADTGRIVKARRSR